MIGCNGTMYCSSPLIWTTSTVNLRDTASWFPLLYGANDIVDGNRKSPVVDENSTICFVYLCVTLTCNFGCTVDTAVINSSTTLFLVFPASISISFSFVSTPFCEACSAWVFDPMCYIINIAGAINKSVPLIRIVWSLSLFELCRPLLPWRPLSGHL